MESRDGTLETLEVHVSRPEEVDDALPRTRPYARVLRTAFVVVFAACILTWVSLVYVRQGASGASVHGLQHPVDMFISVAAKAAATARDPSGPLAFGMPHPAPVRLRPPITARRPSLPVMVAPRLKSDDGMMHPRLYPLQKVGDSSPWPFPWPFGGSKQGGRGGGSGSDTTTLIRSDWSAGVATVEAVGLPATCGSKQLPLTVGLGTCLVPDGPAKQQNEWAYTAGYRLIDTAQRYGNEESVGQALHEALKSGQVQRRKDVHLTTKIWAENMGYDKTLRSFHESRRKMGVDYIDLLLMHWPGDFGRTWMPGKPRELRRETWRAMEQLLEDGLVKSIGVANFGKKHIDEMDSYAKTPPAVSQFEVHPYNARFDLVQLCQDKGISVMGYSPLGGRNAGGPGTGVTTELLEDPTIVAIADRLNKPPAQVILRWSLQRGITPIPKASSVGRIAENLGALTFELTAEDMEKINGLDRNEFVVLDYSSQYA